jgi:hypothetical protein
LYRYSAASSLAGDTSFETRQSSDFVKPTVLTTEEKNARVFELVNGYSERHGDGSGSGSAAPAPASSKMVEMKAASAFRHSAVSGAPPKPAPAPQRPASAAAASSSAAAAAAAHASPMPRVIPASSPSAMAAYEKIAAAEAAAAAAAAAEEAAAAAKTTNGFTMPTLRKPSKAAAEAAVKAVYGGGCTS